MMFLFITKRRLGLRFIKRRRLDDVHYVLGDFTPDLIIPLGFSFDRIPSKRTVNPFVHFLT